MGTYSLFSFESLFGSLLAVQLLIYSILYHVSYQKLCGPICLVFSLGLLNRFLWMQELFPLCGEEILLFKTSISFVDHLQEFISAILTCMPLVIPPFEELKANSFYIVDFLQVIFLIFTSIFYIIGWLWSQSLLQILYIWLMLSSNLLVVFSFH